MKTLLLLALAAPALAAFACNTSGLSNQPRATFSQLACLDINGDDRINGDDASTDMSKLPDFNADDSRDAHDAAFLQGLDIVLDPDRDRAQCEGKAKKTPEYLVAHGYFDPSDVSCDNNAQPVLLVGVGGGNVDLRDDTDAAGVRKVVDKLLDAYDERDTDAIAVIAGPALDGAENVNAGMEDWLTHAVRVYLDRYPCLRAVFLGHSLGAVPADVTAARLEEEYGGRIAAVVDIDRIDIDAFYAGDIQSRPDSVYVFNIYETNDGLHADPYDSPNAENWDASGELGKDDKPVSHTSIDNAHAIHDRIVEEVMERS